jgi:2-dehydro-3-deoxyphosphooctonate aldolase (KDO 8-P synthase)
VQVEAFSVSDVPVGGGSLCLIAGPCLAESAEICIKVAEEVARVAHELGFGYIFKASFDKANRTSGNTARGAGLEAGLAILQAVKDRYHIPITTDIHLPEQAAAVAGTVDLLQIPAFLCRQTDLLHAAAGTGRPVNVKKGQFLAPEDTANIVAKLRDFRASGILLTERGTTFGYRTLIVDMPGLEIMRRHGVPVCFDATHAAQRPGGAGTETAGVRESIPAMCRAAAAVGIDALFLEVHPDPARALSDKETQWPLHRLREILEPVAEIHRLVNNRS